MGETALADQWNDPTIAAPARYRESRPLSARAPRALAATPPILADWNNIVCNVGFFPRGVDPVVFQPTSLDRWTAVMTSANGVFHDHTLGTNLKTTDIRDGESYTMAFSENLHAMRWGQMAAWMGPTPPLRTPWTPTDGSLSRSTGWFGFTLTPTRPARPEPD